MDLSNLTAAKGSRKERYRKGRGHASGNGKTAGKATKARKLVPELRGQVLEGGQMPLYRRLPKRGFKNRNHKIIVGINVLELERFDNDTTVTIDMLIERKIVKNPRDGVKILGKGDLTKRLTVQANAFSAGAKEKIEALGGKAEVV